MLLPARLGRAEEIYDQNDSGGKQMLFHVLFYYSILYFLSSQFLLRAVFVLFSVYLGFTNSIFLLYSVLFISYG